MQDPLKTNKAFQVAYSSHHAHKQFVTPQNIDQLIITLNQIKVQRSDPHNSDSTTMIIPPLLPPRDSTFVESYMKSLPSRDQRDGGRAHRLWDESSGINAKRLCRLAPLDRNQLIQSPQSVPMSHLGPPHIPSPPHIMTSSNKQCHYDISQYSGINHTHNDKSLGSPLGPCKPKVSLIHRGHYRTNQKKTTSSIHSTEIKLRLTPDDRLQESTSLQSQWEKTGLTSFETWTGEDVMDVELIVENEGEREDECDSGWNDEEDCICEDDLLSDINDDESETSTCINTDISGVGLDESVTQFTTWEEQDYTPEKLEVPPELMLAKQSYRLSINKSKLDGSSPSSVIGQIRPTCTKSSVSTMIPPRVMSLGERGDDQASPALTPSLFPGQPATIHFPLCNEKYEMLSSKEQSLLKWKMSTITPNVVKHVITRVGFTSTKGNGWIGYFGKHMKSEAFKAINENQKVNHFPGSFQLGRKDRLWRNMFRMQARYGRKEFDFIPQTFILPNDMKQFKRVWEDGGSRYKWIIKPPAAARGIGVRVINKWSQIPKKKPVIVQRYLNDPLLINGNKIDLRVYVYVTSFDPLIIYIYRDGLVRFATVKYSQSSRSLSNRFVHLTNYSVNKRNSKFQSNSDEKQCVGHKWGLLALWSYMECNMGIDPCPVWEGIKDVAIKTILSCEDYITSLVKANLKSSDSVHELFGFDIMLDKHLKPWLLEVNVSPSLHSNSQLDLNIKEVMMRDLFNLSGFKLPNHDIITSDNTCASTMLSTEERIKHSKYTKTRHMTQIECSKILENMTQDDIRILMHVEDEFSRRGGFIRVFPNPITYQYYSKYFQRERYYNILINQWLIKYSKAPQKGIAELQRQQLLHKKR